MHWEGFETGTKAAAAGGVTTLVDMPLNSNPTVVDVETFDLKLKASANKLHVDVAFWGGLVPDNARNQTKLKALIDAGVVGLKAFMSPSGIGDFENASVDDLKLAGLAHAFDHVQGTDYDKGMKPKPAPDVILAALEGVGGRGEGGRRRVVYVGDTQRDVLAARAAGAIPVSVCYQPDQYDAVASWGADAIVRDMAELPAAIARLVR